MQEQYQEKVRNLPFNPEDIPALKAEIAKILDDRSEKSSLAALADGWGALPWWVKGLILIFITAPLVVVAVYFQLWVLLAVPASLAFIYVGFSLLFDNHYAHETEKNTVLQQKVSGFVRFYEKLLMTMHSIASTLGFEVDALKVNNQSLSQHNQTLKNEIAVFDENLQSCKVLTARLHDENADLQNRNRHLAEVTGRYEELVESGKEALAESRNANRQQQKLLDEQIDAVKLANAQLTLQSTKTQRIIASMQVTQNALLGLDKTKEASLRDFDEKLKTLLDGETEKMSGLTEKIVSLERTITNNQSETEMLNQEYKTIIEAERTRVAFLENIIRVLDPSPELLPSGCGLQAHGMFASGPLPVAGEQPGGLVLKC